MQASVRAFFSRIVDYAGLFPPAGLAMEPAIRNYARYGQEPESWMLGRFVCPAFRFEEAAHFVGELFAEGPPLEITLLGRNKGDAANFLGDLKLDIAATQAIVSLFPRQVIAESFETRLP